MAAVPLHPVDIRAPSSFNGGGADRMRRTVSTLPGRGSPSGRLGKVGVRNGDER